MRTLLIGRQYSTLRDQAKTFARSHGRLLLLGVSRAAADDFVRANCGSTAGIERCTVRSLAAQLATEPMAARGLAPLNLFGLEALAARASFLVKQAGRLPYFAPVASTPGFARAMARTLVDLRLERIAPAKLHGLDLGAVLETYEQLLDESRLADYAQILRLALEVTSSGEHRLLKTPLLLLDTPVRSQLESLFLHKLIAQAPDSMGVLIEGDDESSRRLPALAATRLNERGSTALDRVRRYLFAASLPEKGGLDDTVDFFSAAGEGLEAVEIARRMLALAAEGTPFDEMAILLRTPERYQPLLEEALTRAGVPYWFTKGSTRPDPAGRAFLALLICAQENFPATRFAEYLSLGQAPAIDKPLVRTATAASWLGTEDDLLAGNEYGDRETQLQTDPAPATPVAWERLIVDAAVVGGRDRWQRRLGGLANEFRLRLDRLPEENEAERAHTERQLELLDNLQRLALPVIDRLAGLPKQAPWREWITALQDLAETTLREPESVIIALNELWPMGEVGPVSLDEVVVVLEERLGVLRRAPEKYRYGRVWIGSIDEARGQSFRVVFLPGMAEGIFPQKQYEDPLLLDDARERIDKGLRRRDNSITDERLRLRIAAAVASRRLIASYPRMDVGQVRPRVPSFYAIEAVRAAEGRVPDLKQFEREAEAGAMTRLGWPAPEDSAHAIDALEYDLARLNRVWGKAHLRRAQAAYLKHLNPTVARSLRQRYRRWEQKKWTIDDGVCAEVASLEQYRFANKPYSPSSLQLFASCPYRFYLGAILHLRPRDEAAPIEQMDPATRGALLHEVLQRLSAFIIAGEKDLVTRANATLDEVAAEYAENLAPAIPRVWQCEVDDLRADLMGWIRKRGTDAAEHQLTHAEFGFGLSDSVTPAVDILAGLKLRGSIDWIEAHEMTGHLRVTDHKTGRRPKKIPAHVGGGTVLQPLLYALACEKIFDKPVESTRLYYCTQRGQYESVSMRLNEVARERVTKALTIIDQAIGDSRLMALPSHEACTYCDFRLVCGPREAERTRRKPAIESLTELRGLA